MKLDWKRALPVFVIGLVLGAALGSWVQRAASRQHGKGRPDPSRLVEKFSRELKLDAAQKEAVRAVLDSRRETMKAFHKETSARFSEIRLSMDAEIKKVLTPEQQKAFDAMHARWAARRRRNEDRE